MSKLLVDRILENIKNLASVPSNQDRFSDEIIISNYIEDILDTEILPMLKNLNNGYNLVVRKVMTDDEGAFDIPYDAYLRSLESIELNGAVLSESDLANGVRFEGNRVITNAKNKELTIKYVQTLPRLVKELEVAKIQSVSSNNQIEIVPTLAGQTFNLIDKNDGYIKATVNKISGSSNVLIIDSNKAKAGDYLSADDSSCLVRIPIVLVPLLERLVSNRILLDIPDLEGYVQGVQISEIMKNNLTKVLTPRGSTSKIITKKPFIRR